VRDMARWMSMVLQGGVHEGRRIVAADALLPAVTAQIVSGHSPEMDARASFYGYGFGVGTQPSGRVALSHSGGFALGTATNYVLIPSVGIGIITLSNAAPAGAVEALGAEFADLVQFGSVTRDWLDGYAKLMAPLTAPSGSLMGKAPPPQPAQPAILAAYAGTYANDYYGDAVIGLHGDALVLKIGPADTEYSLRHWDGNIFVFEPRGENATEGSVSAVTFTIGSSGQATSLAIEFFASNGRGTFTRR